MGKLFEFGKPGTLFAKKTKQKLKQQQVLPDEEEIKRSSRRKAAKRFGSGGSGRASTVLTSPDSRLGG